MAKADNKRNRLFEEFSENLHLLVDNGLINLELKYDETYVCPICLNQFSKSDLEPKSPNRLTLEDAPPKSLKGRQIALTCKTCNNICGHEIDFHLTDRMHELDFRERVEGASKKGKISLGDKIVFGELTLTKNSGTQIYVSNKANNPKEVEGFNKLISENKGISNASFKPKPSKVNPKYFQIALLKSAYILMFAKFGYTLILNSEYDRVREQLSNPEKDIYPLKCWFKGPFPKDRYGVPFITEKKLESIFTLFGLHTDKVERTFAVVLPLTTKPIETILRQLNKRFSVEKSFDLEMKTFDPDTNYLNDLEAIKHLINWVDKFKNHSIAHTLNKFSTKELMELINELNEKLK